MSKAVPPHSPCVAEPPIQQLDCSCAGRWVRRQGETWHLSPLSPHPSCQTSISHYRREAEQSGMALARAELELQERDVRLEDLQRLLTGMEKVLPWPPPIRPRT